MSEEKKEEKKLPIGHSAYAVWRIYTDRAILKVAPALGKKSNAQLIFSIFMLVITLLGAIGAGIYIDGYAIHPPAQYTGVCAPPAFIRGQNCLQALPVTVVKDGSTTTTTTLAQAGSIILPNGTAKK